MGVFRRKSKEDALDYKKINEGISVGVNLLRVIFILGTPLLRRSAVAFFKGAGEVKLIGISTPDGDLTDRSVAAAHQLRGFGQPNSNQKFLGWTAHVILEQFSEVAAVEPAGVCNFLHCQVPLIVLLNVVDRLLDIEVLKLVSLGVQPGGGGLHQGVYKEIQGADEVEGGCIGMLGDVEHQVPYLGALGRAVRLVDGLGGGKPGVPQGLRGVKAVKFDPDILPGMVLVGKIGVDQAGADEKPLPRLELIPPGGDPVLLRGIQRAPSGYDIVEEIVVADEGAKGLEGLTLLIAVLKDPQIQEILVWKDGKREFSHKDSLPTASNLDPSIS